MVTTKSKDRMVVVARDVVMGTADLAHFRPDHGTITVIFDRRVAERRQLHQDRLPERRRGVDRRQSGHGPEHSSGSTRRAKARAVYVAAGISSVLLVLILAGTVRMEPVPTPGPPPTSERPATTTTPAPAVVAHGAYRPVPSAGSVRSKAVTSDLPAVPSKAATAVRLKAATSDLPAVRVPTRNQIGKFAATDLSTDAVEVMLDYQYMGDHGRDKVFVHAAALQGEDPANRISGTGFPGEPIAVGSGHVMIRIGRVPDAVPAASTHIRVCMVSLRTRSAFLCETFPFAKAWTPLSSAESGPL